MPNIARARIIYWTLIFICPQRQHSPSVHLVHRRGGMLCWIPFSLAVSGFALRNRFRVVRDLCIVGGGGSIVRAVANIFPDPTSAFTLGAPCAP